MRMAVRLRGLPSAPTAIVGSCWLFSRSAACRSRWAGMGMARPMWSCGWLPAPCALVTLYVPGTTRYLMKRFRAVVLV